MKPVKIKLRVESLALCPARGVVSQPCLNMQAELEGLVGDRHFGFVKKADGRDSGVTRGTPVRNWRQWTAVSKEELAIIASRLSLSDVAPELLGANITFSGVEDLTAVPRGSSIWFPGGAILSVEDENAPCIGPGKEIAKRSSINPQEFVKAALGMRGLVGVVFRAGQIRVGDIAEVNVHRPGR